MGTYILMALAAVAVALLAGFSGGLPGPPPGRLSRSTKNDEIALEAELASQTTCAADAVNRRPLKTPRPNRTIVTGMACAIAVLVGAGGAATFGLATCGCDRPKPQVTLGSSLAYGMTMVGVVRSAQAMPVQTPVAIDTTSDPPKHAANEKRAMRKAAVRTGSMGTVGAVSTYATHLNRGTWLFPPAANGGG